MQFAPTLAALCILGAAVGQRPALPPATGTWLGCERHEFEVDGRACWVVAPRVRAAGNPWVWRARFPQFHTELDQALLEEGLHIAYLDTAGMLGSPRALDHWDRFYDDMIQRGFARRVALEAVSRGGLFAYRWAARHPERVACIYADTPVCDIKSWPLGQGAGRGHAATWQSLLEEYGFSQQQALAFDGNPIDLAATLAAAKIPLLHIVSEDDQVVPPAENTYALQARLRAAGGDLDVLSVPTGTAESHGHHFAVLPEHVRRASEFVLRHTNDTPANARFDNLRGGLGRSHARLAAGGRCRVGFLGGSITHNPGWRDHVAADLKRRFPHADIEFVNAGIPSMGSTPGAFRLERDVLARGRVDLLFVEAAVNDSTNGRTDAEQLRAMEGIVRHARRAQPDIDLVMLHFVDPDKMRALRAGDTPAVIANHERVAEHYGIPSIDLAREVTARIAAGEFTWREDFVNLHPSPFGQRLYARSIQRLFDAAGLVSGSAPTPPPAPALPPPLDPRCYQHGRLLSIDNAVLGTGFARVESWRPTDGKGTRAGFVDVPMLVGEAPGAELSLPFHGTGVGLFVAAGPDAGVLEWSVDGAPFVALDLMTRWSRGLHLPWAHVLAAELDEGPHRLRLRLVESPDPDRTKGAARIAHFLVHDR